MNKETFKTSFQEFIYIRTYSRWVDEVGRRESWKETVTRYCNFMKEQLGDKVAEKDIISAYSAIYNLEVMPSMRALWSAGEAAKQDSFAIYNCAFLTIENIRDFAEMLYILMHGAGIGFSIERKFANSLPVIKEKNGDKAVKIVFEDSKLGWAKGFEKVLNCLWDGTQFECDYSKVRPRGSRLKTFGGRASGPEPLMNLVEFVTDIVEKNRGFQLQPVEIHDICCKIAEVVVVGGVRRSALISLSDLTDNQMANAKMGEFYKMHPQRQLANNSVAYTRTPDIVSFIDEWKNLYRSKSGERGIFNRVSAQKKASENHRRDGSKIVGCNPCGEVLLRSRELCNLTEVIVRPSDDFNSLKRKVQIATMIGTWQASMTHFNFVDTAWKINCEEEALLGVSLSGVCDNPILGTTNDTAKKWLSDLKHVAIQTNKKTALKIGIKRAAAITCNKPSGCLTPDTIIKTNNGDKTLLEIFNSNDVDIAAKQNEMREWYEIKDAAYVYDNNNQKQKITKLFINGIEQTIRLIFDDGNTIECTPHHKFLMTTGKWKMAKDITENDDFFVINQKK